MNRRNYNAAPIKKAGKRRMTVRPVGCCRSNIGTCPVHRPNVSLEVRRGGKWLHIGVLTPEHEWLIQPATTTQKESASV